MNWLGIDIGGANLKLADGKGYATERSFPLWKTPERLADVMADMFLAAPRTDAVAITMTGELADCFATKAEGIRHILASLEQVAGERSLHVYQTGGSFLSVEDAVDHPHAVAAANWHALASWAIRSLPTPSGLLIDIGSTTTDIIPITPEGVSARGETDTERLALGELVYSGVRRTAVATLISEVLYRGGMCSLARESFATTHDVYLTLGQIEEDPQDCDTADFRPATRSAAHRRLARMLCGDVAEIDSRDVHSIAVATKAAQLQTVRTALERICSQHGKPGAALISGSGEFLARDLLRDWQPELPIISLGSCNRLPVSQCAPAHALAILARETFE